MPLSSDFNTATNSVIWESPLGSVLYLMNKCVNS